MREPFSSRRPTVLLPRDRRTQWSGRDPPLPADRGIGDFVYFEMGHYDQPLHKPSGSFPPSSTVHGALFESDGRTKATSHCHFGPTRHYQFNQFNQKQKTPKEIGTTAINERLALHHSNSLFSAPVSSVDRCALERALHTSQERLCFILGALSTFNSSRGCRSSLAFLLDKFSS